MKRKTKIVLLVHAIIILLILFITFSPLLSVIVAGGIANANGCQLDEGSVHPCVVAGQDLGETLYTLGVLGWLMLITIPIGLGVAVLYLFIVVVFYLVRRGARDRASSV